MPAYSFACPHCSTPLRLQDRCLIGRVIDCPDCNKAIVITDSPDAGVVAGPSPIVGTPDSTLQSDNTVRKDRKTSNNGRPLPRWLSVATSPLGVAWIIAGVLSCALLVGLMTVSRVRPATHSGSIAEETPDGSKADEQRPLVDQVGGRLEPLQKSQLEAQQIQTDGPPDEGPMPHINKTPVPLSPFDVSILPSESQPHRTDVEAVPPASIVETQNLIAQLARGEREPIDVPMVGDELMRDVAGALDQQIARFDQLRPVPLHEALRLIEEMAAVQIDASGLSKTAQTRLEQTVRLQIEQTTLREILFVLLQQAELSFDISGDRILLRVSPDEVSIPGQR